MRIGRDHIASTIYTLILAYAGSALPVLLLFTVSGRSTHDVLTGDEIAGEILRGLVGGVGIAASVPITTAVAAAVVAALRRPPADGADLGPDAWPADPPWHGHPAEPASWPTQPGGHRPEWPASDRAWHDPYPPAPQWPGPQ
jgi:hypothetical protein